MGRSTASCLKLATRHHCLESLSPVPWSREFLSDRIFPEVLHCGRRHRPVSKRFLFALCQNAISFAGQIPSPSTAPNFISARQRLGKAL